MKLLVTCLSFFVMFLMVDAARAAGKDCTMAVAVGLSEAESTAVEDLVCAAVHEHAPTGSKYWVRVSSAGGRMVLTLLSEKAGNVAEKQVIVGDIEEVAVAAPRLVEALAEEKRLAETQTVDNLVAAETRPAKKKAGEVHAALGVVGVGAAIGGGAQGGAQFSMTVGLSSISFVGDMRVAGDVANEIVRDFSLGIIKVSDQPQLGYASLATGLRYHLSDRDIAPFAGVGIALDSISMSGEGRSEKNGGVAGTVEIGVDVLRTSTFGGTVAARVDVPSFALEGSRRLDNGTTASTRTYTPIVAAAISLRF